MRTRWFYLVVLGLVAAACRNAGAPPPSQATLAPKTQLNARWDTLVQAYIEAVFERHPGFAVTQGRHEFDGRVADLSQAALEAFVRELESFRERAQQIPQGALDPARRVEHAHLLAEIDGSLFWQLRAREPQRNPLFYANAADPSVYLTRAYAPLPQRLAAYVAHLRQIPRVVTAMGENLVTPLSRTHVTVAIDVFSGLVTYLQTDAPAVFAAVDEAALKAELQAATQAAVAALEEAVRWLKGQRDTANDDFALGTELFREMLWATERVDTPLDALEAEGQRDLERNLSALREACSQFAPAQDLATCVERVNADKPREGPVEAARRQVQVLKRFVLEHDLVSVPGEEQVKVQEAPPHKRWNQAFIEIPGPFERGMPSVYSIAPPDPAWTDAERAAYLPGEADLLFISVHEVWPGHFLQFLHANRAPRLFGRLFVGYAFAEGWAHYSEELMWEAGLGQGDPKVRVGQLLNALLRNVRFLCAIGLHTRGMRVEEAERMFFEKALQDPGNAKQQALRGTFDPAYLNYTLGKLMIRKLRADWTGPRGGERAYRAFHDALLSFGGPPLPLVREAMLGTRGELL